MMKTIFGLFKLSVTTLTLVVMITLGCVGVFTVWIVAYRLSFLLADIIIGTGG